VTTPPTTPLPAAQPRARTLTTKIHSDQEGTAQARREESRVDAKQPKGGKKKTRCKICGLLVSSSPTAPVRFHSCCTPPSEMALTTNPVRRIRPSTVQDEHRY